MIQSKKKRNEFEKKYIKHIEISSISNKDVHENKIDNKKNIKVWVPHLQLLTKYP